MVKISRLNVCHFFKAEVWFRHGAQGSVKILKLKGAGSFHIHRKTNKELGALAVLGVRGQPNLAHNLVAQRH